MRKLLFRSRSGEGYPMVIAVTLCLLMLFMVIAEYFRVNIIVQGVRDAVQQAVIATVNENYDDVYHSVREGYGNVLTESLLTYKVSQYPDGVGNHEDIIRANWLGGRTTDCVGLIKGYGWLSPETMTIDYGTHGMPDIGANQMYYNAKESGTISTMPDIPGLAVWHDGHIGVYIGNGQVVEAMGTRYGVVKTELAGRGWTHWLKVPYIRYD